MNNLFAIPDKKKNHQSYMLFVLTLIWFVAAGVIVSVGFYLFPHLWSRWLIYLGASTFITVFNLTIIAIQHQKSKREDVESIKNQTDYNLAKRVKELKTLYKVSRILQDEDALIRNLYRDVVEVISQGWQYPDITAARLVISGTEYLTANYRSSVDFQNAEMKTSKGTEVTIEVVYLQLMPKSDEGPFLKEERDLIDMLVDMLKTDLERRELSAEIRDYKYALEVASMVSITGVDASFSFVNENFCKTSKYTADELLGQHHSVIWSGRHSPEYFMELRMAMQDGIPYQGEFCNKAKDGTLYWVDSTIVPFLDENKKVYQYLSINHDVTARKKASELYNYHFYNSPDTILVVNKKFAIETLNRALPTGPKLDDIIGRDAIELLPPESREIARKALIRCFETGENQEFENARSFGHWVRSKMVPLISNDEVSHVMIFVSDNTKRKLAEQELQRSEIKNRVLIENISEAIILIDQNENIIFQSPSATKISGYLPEESYGQKTLSFIHSEDVETFKSFLKQVFNAPGEPLPAQFRCIHKFGHIIWLEGTMLNMLDDESIKGIVVNYRDITERKKTEEEIRQSKERYESIITVSNTGAWEYHLDTNRIWYSPEYLSMLGVDCPNGVWETELVPNWSEKLHPDDRERSMHCFDTFLREGSKGLYENHFRMRHEDGHWLWIWSRARRLLDSNGNLTNITLGTHIDITERKLAEEKIKQSEQLLRKITSQVPGNTYKFEIDETGNTKYHFMNRGTDPFNHSVSLDQLSKDPELMREVFHDYDQEKFNNALKEAYLTNAMISLQYRIVVKGQIRWRWLQAVPEKEENGSTMWYGVTSDITPLVDYIASIEQIVYDISHVIRRPISSMMGLTTLIINGQISENEMKSVSQKLYQISEEMDKFICELTEVYNRKRENTLLNIDVTALIDKRNSLFSRK